MLPFIRRYLVLGLADYMSKKKKKLVWYAQAKAMERFMHAAGS